MVMSMDPIMVPGLYSTIVITIAIMDSQLDITDFHITELVSEF